MTQTTNQSSKREFTKVSGGTNGVKWAPQMTEKNFMKPTDPPSKMGYLVGDKDIQGPTGLFKVYQLQEVHEDGSFGNLYDVSGDKVLNDKFSAIPFGSFILAEYKGRVHKPEIKKAPGYHAGAPFTQTNSYHMWEVGVDNNAIPYAEAVKMIGAKVATDKVLSNMTKPSTEESAPFTEDDDLPF